MKKSNKMGKKVLVTGASGYIGSQLIVKLLNQGHQVVAMVRDPAKYTINREIRKRIKVIVGDLQKPETLDSIPTDIQVAYYLVHAMALSISQFEKIEKHQAENFVHAIKNTSVKQVIYLGGLVSSDKLSRHLSSRQQVEKILKASNLPCTILRAGIIIGEGSASFEIIRDLVEKLPIMIAPKWVQSKCQPIGISDMIAFLTQVIDKKECIGQTFDVAGDEQLTYKEMLYGYADCRGLTRTIIKVPVLTPKLSSYWLYFVSSTNFFLAMALVDSLKVDAICCENRIQNVIPRKCLSYKESVAKSLDVTNHLPKFGCLIDETKVDFEGDRQKVINRVWSIGGKKGWYALDWAWQLRGWFDQLIGGVGIRRGRDHQDSIEAGDHLDFWRVIIADREGGHLLLRAEMIVPGEAWLEFLVTEDQLVQTATFRPKGVFGRAYWYLLLPFHLLIFSLMAKKIVKTGIKSMERK
ncbi:MAG: SDR family oxidoreductase [Chlamydiota bacterium]